MHGMHVLVRGGVVNHLLVLGIILLLLKLHKAASLDIFFPPRFRNQFLKLSSFEENRQASPFQGQACDSVSEKHNRHLVKGTPSCAYAGGEVAVGRRRALRQPIFWGGWVLVVRTMFPMGPTQVSCILLPSWWVIGDVVPPNKTHKECPHKETKGSQA